MIFLYLAAGISLATVIYRIIRVELWLRSVPRPGPDLSEQRRQCLRKVAKAIRRENP